MSQSVFGRRRSRPATDDVTTAAPRPEAPVPGAPPAVDLVTGLPDRHNLLPWVERAVERSHHASTRALVVFVDIGLLRNVNDTYGPDFGDHLLREVGARLSTIDVPGTKVLRWGGAEFVIVFEKVGQRDAGDRIGEFIVELLTPPFQIGHDSITIECYVGGAISDDSYTTQSDLIRDAHQSVIDAIREGPGSVVVWDESQRNRYATRITDDRLQQAIEEEEFLLLWQPIVRLGDRAMVGAESLIRWKAPNASTIGLLLPNEFLPQLETSGLIVPVGRWVLRATCLQVAEWTRANPDHRAVFGSCNLGGRQLAQSDFRETVVAAIEESGIEPWQLCLDLTEVALGYNHAAIWTQLRDLKRMGVKLGLDDFGTGESSVGYLRDFRVDFIHLAKGFVTNVNRDPEDRAIIRHLTALGHELDLTVVGQGVESTEEAEALLDLGVDLGQGFHFGRPEYPAVIDALMKPEGERGPTGWEPEQVMKATLLDRHAESGPDLRKG